MHESDSGQSIHRHLLADGCETQWQYSFKFPHAFTDLYLTDYHADIFMHALPLGVTSLIQTQNIHFVLSIFISSPS